MTKAMRTTLSLVVALVLFSALTMAQTAGNANKNKDTKEHHSRLSKAAFWRHKEANKNAKQTKPTQASKQPVAKTAQLKPVSAKVSASKKNQKQAQHASKVSKPIAKKAPAASKTKPQPKA
jgi:hypothetical protein